MDKTKLKVLIILFSIMLILSIITAVFLLYQNGYLNRLDGAIETMMSYDLNNPGGINQKQSEQGIVITEVCSKGSEYVSENYGESFDWIELYNTMDFDISLNSYCLTDDLEKINKFSLPDVVVGGGQYIVVFASGKDEYKDNEIHTNFKISSKGETISLYNDVAKVQTIVMPELLDGFSYGISDDGSVGFLNPTTPLSDNETLYESMDIYFKHEIVPNGIYINEFASKDQIVIMDDDGQFGDWIEIINTTSEKVNIEGYSLTDDITSPRKWQFDQRFLESGQCLLVFADKKDRISDNYLHSNFSLSTSDEELYLFDESGVLIDSITIVETSESISYGRSKDDFNIWNFFDVPTPGQQNTIEGSTQKKTLFERKQKYVYINEVKTTKPEKIREFYDHYDYIELYNNTDQDINLSGFGVSDSKLNLFKWTFPNGTILAPNDYTLVLANAEYRGDKYGDFNAGFFISAFTEDIYLTNPNGYIVDRYEAMYTRDGHTVSKEPDGSYVIYTKATPKAENDADKYLGYCKQVEFSTDSGSLSDKLDLELTCENDDMNIYYTLDDSEPKTNSLEYIYPIEITEDTNVKAISTKYGYISSKVETKSYIFGKSHDVPIVLLTIDEKYLYGSDGLLSNAGEEIKVPAHVKIYEPNQGGGISFDAIAKLFGNSSRWDPQRSFAIEVAEYNGGDRIQYDLFPGDEKTPDEYETFVFRNGGSEEWNRTKLTDAALTSLARLALDVDSMAYRPCALYFNGKYYGLMNIREKLNRDYITIKYGYEKDTIDIIEPIPGQEYAAIQGYSWAFEALVDYIHTKDMTKDEHYDYVKKRLDIDNYIDTVLSHIILGNMDSGNIKFYRPQIEGAKWRALLFDLDRAAYYPTNNHLKLRTSIEGHGSGKSFDTDLIRGLLENPDFRYQFCKRAVELCDTIYSPEFSETYYKYLAVKIDNEMKLNLDVWWEKCYNRVSTGTLYSNPPEKKKEALAFIYNEQERHKRFLRERKQYFIPQLKDYFDLTNEDIEQFRQEIEIENSPATQIYDEFISTNSISMAIDLSNSLDTITIY